MLSVADVLFLVFAVGVIYLLFFRGKSKSSPSAESAWLPGPGEYAFDIVGESKYQTSLERICGGRSEDGAEKYVRAVLHLEDNNAFDNRAVRVDVDGLTVGYLSRESARQYRAQLAQLGHPRVTGECNAVIVGGWSRPSGDMGHFGVRLDLPVA